MSIIKNIKKHQIVTAIVFVSGAIIGLSSFTQAIGSISEAISCIPNKLGWDDGTEGSGKLTYRVQEYDWVKIGEVSKNKPTRNHHCSRHCKGEPTRTNYSVEVSIDDFSSPKLGDKKLMNPKVSCIAGPCGFSKSYGVKLVGSIKARASFDVWSKPTTWSVKADVYQFQVVSETESYEEFSFSKDSLLALTVPKNSIDAIFEGKYGENNIFSFNVGDKGKDIFSLTSKTEANNQKIYKYKITNTECK